jgi:ArsR family transcriptional regulator
MSLGFSDQVASFDTAVLNPGGGTVVPPPAETRLASGDVAKDLVELFKLLADETRLRILFLLQQRRELNVRTLCQILGQSQPAVSHHLALLRTSGLIEMRRAGKHNFYRLLPQRCGEWLRLMFSALPGDAHEIRFADCVVRYSQAVSA